MNNNLENPQPHTQDGAHIPQGTLCSCGCGQIVGMESYARIGADQFFIEGHEQNHSEDPTLH